MQYFLDRLKERSTWIGLISLVGVVGVTLNPEQTEAIVTAGVGLVSAIATFTKD